ncbi:helix-turn-helix transcriptional regulator [Burkholderia cenocepacia]|nr:helix-turn-helix transcriptional regulator [Burkholderia cenocepacia]MCO1398570.1 helix-turn-helix domain-containing protein [Burkholderia cenocepacia]MCO1411306.1 helix-turn-helix domain-containing protein [Burkholderia cenocepacia]MDA3670323.1 helix-turn-helix transcriptional regulator [Burkholderia cenocepacia]MDA3680255.1 helix-turn-helix transcriptional regulator [Burkholderia cenocepacia]MDA3687852.1 helix-turn-helix transcriptional regulator [Burkholderia cenocepacia]
MRDERLRIGLSQDEFATVGGVARRSQSAYESDERAPDAAYLLAVREIGVDIGYVLTGKRFAAGEAAPEAGARDADEAEVLAMYRQLNDTGKASLHAFLASCISTGAMVQTATPRRAKRVPEKRRAALDQRTAENVDRAMAEIERLKAERAAKQPKK